MNWNLPHLGLVIVLMISNLILAVYFLIMKNYIMFAGDVIQLILLVLHFLSLRLTTGEAAPETEQSSEVLLLAISNDEFSNIEVVGQGPSLTPVGSSFDRLFSKIEGGKSEMITYTTERIGVEWSKGQSI